MPALLLSILLASVPPLSAVVPAPGINAAISAEQPAADTTGHITILGTVAGPDNEPAPGATVLLLHPQTEEMITGTSADNSGQFSITTEPEPLIIRISFVSYETREMKIDPEPGETIDLGTIRLREDVDVLDEIIVEGDPVQMQMQFDRRIYSTEQDAATFGGSVLELMDYIPSVETDLEGNISLRGSDNVRVLINGRPSALLSGGTEALEALPAESIERIEVITNPSSRYDAEGDAGVINIVLKRNRAVGFNGSIVGSTGLPGRAGITSNLNFMTNSANWFTTLSFRYRERPSEGTRFQQFSSPDTSYSYSQVQDRLRTGLQGNARVGAEFFLTENQTLTPSVFFRVRGRDNTSETFYRDMDFDGNLIREVLREDIEDEMRTNIELNLAYDYRFGDDRDRRLRADVKFDFQPETEYSNLTEAIPGGMILAEQRRDSREEVTDLLFQADYTQPLGPAMEMEAGLKSTFRWVDNQFTVDELHNGDWVRLENFSDNFGYYENINAVYGIISRQWGRFSAQAGLRAEQSVIRSELDNAENPLDLNYLGLYPSLFVNYEFDGRNSVQASYSRRLSRPRFRWIRPFSNYRDSRNIYTGNPGLQPVISNSFEIGYLRQWETGSVLTSIYHRYRTDVVEQITRLQDDGVTLRTPVNLSEQFNWGLELSVSQRLSRSVNMRGSANYFFSETEGSYQDQIFERETSALFGRFRVQWEMLSGVNLQTDFRYRGPRNTTQGRRAESWSVNSGLAIRMFDGNATLAISASDLFNTRGRNIVISDPDFYSEDEFRWRTRSVRINFTYRFSQFD